MDNLIRGFTLEHFKEELQPHHQIFSANMIATML
jgi:hypothetical protein